MAVFIAVHFMGLAKFGAGVLNPKHSWTLNKCEFGCTPGADQHVLGSLLVIKNLLILFYNSEEAGR